jgi:hypothetical protein
MIPKFLRKLHIGFYGHSAACFAGLPESFIDQIAKDLDAKIVNVGVPQGSEERALFDLKKTKTIDIAIIFHSGTPRYLFLPKCKRDVSVNSIPENKADILWDEDDSRLKVSPEEFEKQFSYGQIPQVFGNMETFINCMRLHKQFLHHVDLAKNRYEGAKCLIDLYCLQKIPKVIHIIDPHQEKIGEWFKFQSGIVNYDIGHLTEKHRYTGPGQHPNNISDEGNKLIAEKILEIIKTNKWHK